MCIRDRKRDLCLLTKRSRHKPLLYKMQIGPWQRKATGFRVKPLSRLLPISRSACSPAAANKTRRWRHRTEKRNYPHGIGCLLYTSSELHAGVVRNLQAFSRDRFSKLNDRSVERPGQPAVLRCDAHQIGRASCRERVLRLV